MLGVDSSISCYLCHLLHHHPEHELNTCCGQHQGQVRITLSVTKQHSPCFRFPVLNCYFRKLLLTTGEVKWMMNINTAKYHFDTLVELRWMTGHSLLISLFVCHCCYQLLIKKYIFDTQQISSCVEFNF